MHVLFENVGEPVPQVDDLLVGVVHFGETLDVDLADDAEHGGAHYVRIRQVEDGNENGDGRHERIGDALGQILEMEVGKRMGM